MLKPCSHFRGGTSTINADHVLQEAGKAIDEVFPPAAARGLHPPQEQEYSAAAWWAIMLSRGLRLHHDQGVNPTLAVAILGECAQPWLHVLLSSRLQLNALLCTPA